MPAKALNSLRERLLIGRCGSSTGDELELQSFDMWSLAKYEGPAVLEVVGMVAKVLIVMAAATEMNIPASVFASTCIREIVQNLARNALVKMGRSSVDNDDDEQEREKVGCESAAVQGMGNIYLPDSHFGPATISIVGWKKGQTRCMRELCRGLELGAAGNDLCNTSSRRRVEDSSRHVAHWTDRVPELEFRVP